MAVLRTAQLFLWTSPVGESIVYVCPPGHRAILRSVDTGVSSIITGETRFIYLTIYKPGSIHHGMLFSATCTSEKPFHNWVGTCVLEPGDTLRIGGDVGFNTQGSGALLPIP